MTFSDAYADFLLGTDDYHASITDGRRVIDAISLQNYSLRRAMTGKDPKKVIQNGKTIKNYIQLKHKDTAHFFGVGGTESTTQPQLIEEMETPWSFFRDNMTWDEEIFDFHEGTMAERFVDLRYHMQAACYQEKIKFLETKAFWATPDPATMETNSPKPAVRHTTPWNVLVNEEADSLPSSYLAAGVTTIQGIDPRTSVGGQGWQCQRRTYAGSPSGADCTLKRQLATAARRSEFLGLPLGFGAYSNPTTMPAVIWCSYDGYDLLEEEMQRIQDLVVSKDRQDPSFNRLHIYNVLLEPLPILETAVIFPGASAGLYTVEKDSSSALGGPRYFGMNLMDMYVVVHSTKFFYKHKPRSPYEMPNRNTVFVDSYLNTTAETRRSSFIVSPSADITGYSEAV